LLRSDRRQRRSFRAEYFSGTRSGPLGGGQESWSFTPTTAWQRRAVFCEFPETFFGRRDSKKNAAKFRVGGVGRTAPR
jgi:hypothetical protein